MKFTCERCGKKYATAEDPAPGRVYKLKCKACGHLIVVKPATSAVSVAAFEAPAGTTPLSHLDPSIGIEIEAPEPAHRTESGPHAHAHDATTEVPSEKIRAHALEMTPAPGSPGYVDLFSDVSGIQEIPQKPADDPFLAAARGSLPASHGAPPVLPPLDPAGDSFADLRDDISAASSPEPPPRPPPPVPKVPSIPKPKQEKSAMPLVLIGAGVAVMVGILAFVMLSSGKKAPAPQAAAPAAAVKTAEPPPPAPPPKPEPELAQPEPPAPPPPAGAGDAEKRARAEQAQRDREEAAAKARAEKEAAAAKGRAEREAREARARDEREAKALAKAERDAALKAERDAKARAEREAKARAAAEKAERDAAARAEREAAARAEREARAQREREAREAKERAAAEARERAERQRVAAAGSQEPSDSLTQAQIEGVLRGTKPEFDACIQAARGGDIKLDGRRVMLRLNIQPTGAVTYPTLDDVTLNGTDLGSCLKSAARVMVFPKFSGDTMHVEVPLVMR